MDGSKCPSCKHYESEETSWVCRGCREYCNYDENKNDLEVRVKMLEAKVARLSARGIEDMQHTIAELGSVIEVLAGWLYAVDNEEWHGVEHIIEQATEKAKGE